MRCLIACEFSGIVRDSFHELGWEAWSCDLIESEGDRSRHIKGDVLDYLTPQGDGAWRCVRCAQTCYGASCFLCGEKTISCEWDLMVFHWPCTYMLNSGVRWFTTIPKKPRPGVLYGEQRRNAMEYDAMRFKQLLECGIPHICGENPTMYGKAQEIIGAKWTQKIQPYEFGHTESKATFLWLKNLPPLKPTNDVYDEMMKLPRKEREKVHYASPGPERSKNRSRTYPGIAKAMATQWTEYYLNAHRTPELS